MKIILNIIIVIILSTTLYSQSKEEDKKVILDKKNPDGTEFWLCFMRNHNETPNPDERTRLTLQLFITSDFDANVVVEIKNIGFKEKVFVKGGTVVDLTLDPRAQIKTSDVVEENAAVHITSDSPIIVYGLNRRKQTTDTFMGLPTTVIGQQYRVMCYDGSDLFPEFAVVATEDETSVTITPTVETFSGHQANVPFTVTLNKGDVFQVSSRPTPFSSRKWDLSGSLIISSKKVSVFSGHQCAYVPDKVIACNHLVEQIPPIPSWGRHYYIGMLKKRKHYSYRVLASMDSTKVFEDAKLIKILKAGDFVERNVGKPVQITASNPVLVAQYSQGFSSGDQIGDPMMLLISPTQQFLTKYRFTTPVKGFWDHFVNLVVPQDAIGTIKLDGVPVDSVKFQPLGDSRYSIAYLTVNYGTRELTCAKPFGMTSYGFGYDKDEYDAYGSTGGQSFIDYKEAQDSLPPIIQMKTKNNQTTLYLRDDRPFDKGISSIKILKSNGIEMQIPSFDSGLPQMLINLKPINEMKQGVLEFEVKDEAGNANQATICYAFDPFANRFIFTLNNELGVSCTKDPTYIYGAFLKYSSLNHIADFNKTAGMIGFGKTDAERLLDASRWGNFNNSIGSGGYFGISISKQYIQQITFSLRLSFENIGGVLQSYDSLVQTYRDPKTGVNGTFQEGRTIKLDNYYLNFSFASEWYLKSYCYLVGGISSNLALSKSIDTKRVIIVPVDYIYDNGTREKSSNQSTLSTINTLRIGGFVGFGFIYPITDKISPFIEFNYNVWLSNIINDGNWNVNNKSILLGARVNL
jgi:hypothetical protein